MNRATILILAAAAALAACRGTPPTQCGKGTHLEGNVCVPNVSPPSVGPTATGTTEPAAMPAETKPSDAKPSEEQLAQIARRTLASSEDSKYFAVKAVRIANTITEGKTLTAKIKYTVTARGRANLFSGSGAKHILPLGGVSAGQRLEGGFTLIMKKYDKGWEVDSYHRD